MAGDTGEWVRGKGRDVCPTPKGHGHTQSNVGSVECDFSDFRRQFAITGFPG